MRYLSDFIFYVQTILTLIALPLAILIGHLLIGVVIAALWVTALVAWLEFKNG